MTQLSKSNELTAAEVRYIKDHIRVELRDELPNVYRDCQNSDELRRWMEYFFLHLFQTLKIRWHKGRDVEENYD